MEKKYRPPLEFKLVSMMDDKLKELIKSVIEFHPVINLLKPENENEKEVVEKMKKCEEELILATKLYDKIFEKMKIAVINYEIVIRSNWN